ncbi:MAG TPA: hypothetical protein VFJ64_04310 [Solirubrobacterales bacterium]|nr:hypothetical protein [Solirubrobacterales bacterium]
MYYWQAEYGGDTLHEESASTCGDEREIVRAKTSISTTLSGDGKKGAKITVNEGFKVRDQATLSGIKASGITGDVRYLVYADEECEEPEATAGEVTIEEGGVPPSPGVALKAGVYYWQAVYGGDYLHERVEGECGSEVDTVEESTLSLTTSLSAGELSGNDIEVDEETPVTDTATLAGSTASTATGTVDYAVYEDEECEELATKAGEVEVTKGEVPPSEAVTLIAGTTYYWQARYLGDGTHEEAISICGDEQMSVAEPTSVTTTLAGWTESAEEIEPDTELTVLPKSFVYDTASLSGKYAENATGLIAYDIYKDAKCTELFTSTSSVELEEKGVVPPSGMATLPPGTYYWQATYYGDALNQGSTSACSVEVEKVLLASLTTELEGEGQSGSSIEVQAETPVADQATLDIENAATASGTVSYDVYTDESCEKFELSAGEVEVEEGSVPKSESVELPYGTYYWLVSYSGDSKHAAVTSDCGNEVQIVMEGTSLKTTLMSKDESGENIKVVEGTVVTDKAVLSGPNAGEATGTVGYKVYGDAKCTEVVTETGEVDVEGETIPASEEISQLDPGTYYWQAAYSGDSANKPSLSPCGSEIETVTTAPITTSLSGEEQSGEEISVQEGTAVSDSATFNIEGGASATGTVDYRVFSDPDCKKEVTGAGEMEVEGEGQIPDSEPVELPKGTYYWQASYSGDSEHAKAESACGMEQLQVVGPPWWIVSVGDSYIGGEGGRWAGNVVFNHMGIGPVPLLASTTPMDALGGGAYNDGVGAESLKLCHRSRSAEIHIQVAMDGTEVKSKNLACTGARTRSRAVVERGETLFKPGLDFLEVAGGNRFPPPESPIQEDNGVPCPLNQCKGQALQLQEFAQGLWDDLDAQGHPKHEKIKMVVVSIGGNDFRFGDIVERCAEIYLIHLGFDKCRDEGVVREPFEGPWVDEARRVIKIAIERVGRALLQVQGAEYHLEDFTILVQDYESPMPPVLKWTLPLFGSGLELWWPRAFTGRCPFTDADATFANNTALTTIDNTVRLAAGDASRSFLVRFMKLDSAFNGQRLCESGLKELLPGDSWERRPPMDKLEWINQVRLTQFNSPFLLQEDFHPNFFGQLALRDCLRLAFRNGNPEGLPINPSPSCVPVHGGERIIRIRPGISTMRGPFQREPLMKLVR